MIYCRRYSFDDDGTVKLGGVYILTKDENKIYWKHIIDAPIHNAPMVYCDDNHIDRYNDGALIFPFDLEQYKIAINEMNLK
jgi:hypothetical protein